MSFDLAQALVLIVFLFGLVPSLTGTAVGGVLSAVVDLIKFFAIPVAKKVGYQFKEGFWGIVALVLNVVVFIGLFLLTGGDPTSAPLPPALAALVEQVDTAITLVSGFLYGIPDAWMEIIFTLAASVITAILQLVSGGKVHDLLVRYAPKLFSATKAFED